jgi:hypothetical protein
MMAAATYHDGSGRQQQRMTMVTMADNDSGRQQRLRSTTAGDREEVVA